MDVLWLLCVLTHMTRILVRSEEVTPLEEPYPTVVEKGDENGGGNPLTDEGIPTFNHTRVKRGARSKRGHVEGDAETGLFYEMTFDPHGADDHWVDFDSLDSGDVINSLSSSGNGFLRMEFNIRFFGIDRDEVFISSDGYAHFGPSGLSYMGSTFYAAPLLTNLNPGASPDSQVLIYVSDAQLVTEWRNVRLDTPDALSGQPVDGFTFQLILSNDGTIVFAYRNIPMPLQDIRDAGGAVTIGVNDGFLMKTAQGTTIASFESTFENMDITMAGEEASIVFTPLITCNMAATCSECMQMEPPNADNPCYWCDGARLCGDGYPDGNTHAWTKWKCDELKTTKCPSPKARPNRAPHYRNVRTIFGGAPPAGICRFGNYRYLY